MKKKILCVSMSIFLITYVYADNKLCPSINNESFLTKNLMGNSSYTALDFSQIIQLIQKQIKLDLSAFILDVGGGFGGNTYQFIKLGARDLYFNELDGRNLMCAEMHLKNVFKDIKINFIKGDVLSPTVMNKLPNNGFSLIYAVNVIHFFRANKLIDFVKMLNKKSKKSGIVILVFENKYINRLDYLVDSIFQAHKKFPTASLNKVVKVAYERIKIDHVRFCSYEAYDHMPIGMKVPGFPCEIPIDAGICQLLAPDLIVGLMDAAGFGLVYGADFTDKYKTFLLVFKLEDKLASKTIDRNIKNYFYGLIKQAEQNAKKRSL